MDITNSRILITGGTGVLGSALVRALSAHTPHITIVGRNQQVLTEMQSQYDITSLIADLSLVQDRKIVCTHIAKNPVDMVIHCAGILTIEPFENTDFDAIQQTIDINLTAAVQISQQAIKTALVRNRKVKIVPIASVGADMAMPFFGSYGATKFGVKGLCQGLTREYDKTAVSILLVAPRTIKSDTMDVNIKHILNAMMAGADTPEYIAKRIIKAIKSDKRRLYFGRMERIGIIVNGVMPIITDMLFKVWTPIIKRHITPK